MTGLAFILVRTGVSCTEARRTRPNTFRKSVASSIGEGYWRGSCRTGEDARRSIDSVQQAGD